MKPWHHYLRSALFLVVVGTAWYLPRRAQRRLSAWTARFVHRLAPRLRRRIEKNLTRALCGEVAPAELRASVRAVLTNYGNYVLDFLALSRGRSKDVQCSRRGEHHLRDALATRRGVILVTAHLGSWEMAALFLADHAKSITLVSRAEEIGYLGEMRSTIRSRLDHDELLVGKDPMAALALLGRLRAGGMVGMQIDRAVGSSFLSVPFCGARFRMPRGPARLAHASEALVIPVFALFADDGGYELVVEPSIDPRGLTEAQILARLAAVLERYVRSYPRQWLMMQDPWDDSPAAAKAADGERRDAVGTAP